MTWCGKKHHQVEVVEVGRVTGNCARPKTGFRETYHVSMIFVTTYSRLISFLINVRVWNNGNRIN